MTKLVLAFTLWAIIFGVIHSGVSQSQKEDSSGQLEDDKSQNLAEDELEDGTDRAGKPYGSGRSNGAAESHGPGRPVRHECLSCVGCPSPLNSTVKLCGLSFDPSKQRKCVIYGEKYHNMKEPWVIRGCASERGSCADVRAAHAHRGDLVKLLYCRDCEGDRCNDSNGAGIPHSISDLFIAFLAMIVTPVITKYTMS